MTFRFFLWSVGIFTIGATAAFLVTLFLVDPDESGLLGRILFFGSLGIIFSGSAIIILSEWYRKALGEEGAAHHAGLLFRQGVLIGGYGVTLVLFQYWKIFFWWTALLLLAFFLLIELTCRGTERRDDSVIG
jgi:hypothetical protein